MKHYVYLGEYAKSDIIYTEDYLLIKSGKNDIRINFNDIKSVRLINTNELKHIKREERKQRTIAKKASTVAGGIAGGMALSTLGPIAIGAGLVYGVSRLTTKSIVYECVMKNELKFVGVIQGFDDNKALVEYMKIDKAVLSNRHL